MNMTWEEIVQAVHSGVPSEKKKQPWPQLIICVITFTA